MSSPASPRSRPAARQPGGALADLRAGAADQGLRLIITPADRPGDRASMIPRPDRSIAYGDSGDGVIGGTLAGAVLYLAAWGGR